MLKAGKNFRGMALALALALGLGGCGVAWLEGDPPDVGNEVFEFVMEPGTMDAAEVERRVADMSGGSVVPGSGVHVASVPAPNGERDFFEFQVTDPEIDSGPVWCTMAATSSGAGAGCGDDQPPRARWVIEVAGEEFGSTWRSVEVRVMPDVAQIEGLARDGTGYLIVPVNGLGFVEWKAEHGWINLVALDADGVELGNVVAGREP